MAIVNRRSGMAHGPTKVYQSQVAGSWKGLQSLRNFAAHIARSTSQAQAIINVKMVEFAGRFRSFAPQTRQDWDGYAGSLGSAVDREMNDNVSYAKYVIPHRRKLMSGIDVYVARNIEGFLAGMATPLDIPPAGAGTPPPPLHVAAEYLDGKLLVKWLDPVLEEKPASAFVRLWVQPANRHSLLLAHISVPACSADRPSRGSMNFTKIRPGRLLATMPDDVLVRVQLDTISQSGKDVAPVISPASNVAETVIVND